MITKEEYEEAQEKVWDYEEQVKKRTKIKKTNTKVLTFAEQQVNLKSANNIRAFCNYVMHEDSDLHEDSKAWIKDNLGVNICYKTNEPCQHGCDGLCRESC